MTNLLSVIRARYIMVAALPAMLGPAVLLTACGEKSKHQEAVSQNKEGQGGDDGLTIVQQDPRAEREATLANDPVPESNIPAAQVPPESSPPPSLPEEADRKPGSQDVNTGNAIAQPSAKPPVAGGFPGRPPIEGQFIEKWAPPDPYGKLKGLDNTFGSAVKWEQILPKINRNLEPSDYSDLKYVIPLLTGVRICDGVMAIKTKEPEVLKKCADDIENLGRRLGVSEEDLQFARTVREKALQGDWLEVYTNLSLLQNRVQAAMSRSSALTSTLVMVGGWMQGARYVAAGVRSIGDSTSWKVHPSYFLREPKMVEWLMDQVGKNAGSAMDRKKELDQLVASLKQVAKLVDLDIDPRKGRMSSAGLVELEKLTAGIVTGAISSKNP